MSRNYAALPHEYLEEMKDLSDAEFGRLCRALLLYSMTGRETQLQGAERLLLRRVYMQENRYQESYDEVSKKRSEAGKAGAEKRWGKKAMANAINAMANDGKAMASYGKNGYTETETNTDSLLSDDSKREYRACARDCLPSAEEADAYIRSLGGNEITSRGWYALYAPNWRTMSGQPITPGNWREIARRYVDGEML